jgi:hypothetical protein
LVLVSDGESTPDDYAAAKAQLLDAGFLTRLSHYSVVRVLLIGVGASSGVVDMFQVGGTGFPVVDAADGACLRSLHAAMLCCCRPSATDVAICLVSCPQDVMTPIRELTTDGIVATSFDFIAVEDAMPSPDFVTVVTDTTTSLSSEGNVEVKSGGAAVNVRPVTVGGRGVVVVKVRVTLRMVDVAATHVCVCMCVSAALMCVSAVLCGASTRCLGLSTPTPSTVCRCPWCLLACRLALVRC